jgi:hypothetical protein
MQTAVGYTRTRETRKETEFIVRAVDTGKPENYKYFSLRGLFRSLINPATPYSEVI